MLVTSPKQPLPPGCFITKSLYHEGMFASPASPGLVLLVIMGVSTATTRAGCSYLFRRFLIKFFPVFVMPAWANRHSSLPFLNVQFYYITILKGVVSLYH